MPLLVWGPMFHVGFEEIDRQHARLVELANQLADAVQQGKGMNVLQEVYAGLLLYTQTHFSTEERLMSESGYAGRDRHREKHQVLTSTINDFKGRIASGNPALVEEAMRFFTDWLKEHIMSTDKALAAHLRCHATEKYL